MEFRRGKVLKPLVDRGYFVDGTLKGVFVIDSYFHAISPYI